MTWLNILLRLFVKEKIKPKQCHLCYDSGVVRLTTRNKHFIEGDYQRECPNGCALTPYGRGRLERRVT